MACPNGGRLQIKVFEATEADHGKRSDNVIETASGDETGDVLEEDEARTDSLDDSRDIVEEPSLVSGSFTPAGGAPWLTREAAGNEIASVRSERVEVGVG